VRYKHEVDDGEHATLVDPVIWQRVQAMLRRNGRTGGAAVRNQFGSLLKGLIRCVPCDCATTPTHSTHAGSTHAGTIRYRYYVCSSAQKKGWHITSCTYTWPGRLRLFLEPSGLVAE